MRGSPHPVKKECDWPAAARLAHLCASRRPLEQAGRFISGYEPKPGLFGNPPVQVSVADVDVFPSPELSNEAVELVLQDGKVHCDPVLLPEPALAVDGAVGAAPYQEAPSLRLYDHVHGNAARWFTNLQRSVDVETNERSQTGLLFGLDRILPDLLPGGFVRQPELG